MARGNLVSALDPFFTQLMTAKAAASKRLADALRGNAAALWFLQPAEGWNGDPSAIAELGEVFTRDISAASYAKAVDSGRPGTVADTISTKLQSEMLATAERAARCRLASQVRLQLLSAARRRGHGDAAGVFGGLQTYVQRILQQGGTP